MNRHEVRRSLTRAIDRWENEGGATYDEEPLHGQRLAGRIVTFRYAESLPSTDRPFLRGDDFEGKERAT
jgi:hypothetical protein